MKEQEPCELLIKAKSLAIKRGLDDTKVECPVIDVCKGTRCYLFEATDTDENELIAEDLRCLSKNEPLNGGTK